jgi:hypothetical protein
VAAQLQTAEDYLRYHLGDLQLRLLVAETENAQLRQNVAELEAKLKQQAATKEQAADRTA